MLKTRKRGQYRNIGLLIIRIGVGILFILRGYPTVFGGPERWEAVGNSMLHLGLDIGPMFFGFMGGAIELFGGLFLVLGVFFTPTTILLFLLMGMETARIIYEGGGLPEFSPSLELALVFLGMLFIGPGQYSVDRRINRRRRY